MAPPIDIDLNQAPSNERVEFNFDLNQAPSEDDGFEKEANETEHVMELNEEDENENDTETEHVMELNEEDENEYATEEEAEHVMELNEEDVSEYESETGHSMEHNESESLVNFEGTDNGRKFLKNEDRTAISHILLQHSSNGRLNRGIATTVASMYLVSVSVIRRIWRRTRMTGDASHQKTRNCGRKRIQLDRDQFRQIPLSKRTTYRDLAIALNTNKSSLARMQKLGVIRRMTSAIKPFLKEENKISRLKFCLSMLESNSLPHDPTFKSMYNIVHIDEKWFYLTKRSMKYYLLPEEDAPERYCKSKNYIPKIMFLTAIARPRFDSQWNETFSGKIGVFPFITKEPAKRNSVNRVAGTLETKPITSVNKEVSKKVLLEQVVPAMKEIWPRDDISNPIFIQQDNARCHVKENDKDFCKIAKEDGFDIRLMCQPPNSPDFNVLDLGFFSAIQSLQHKEAPKTVDELIRAVKKAFETFSTIDSNKIFITLQTCMAEVMKERGTNRYDLPHIKKEIMQREGRLPTAIKCDPSLVEEVVDYLRTISD